MRLTLPLLLLWPTLLAAAAATPAQPTALTDSAQALSPTASPTPDTRVRQLMDALRWQPDPKRAALQVQVTQVGTREDGPEVLVMVTDLAGDSAAARQLYANSFPDALYLGAQALPPNAREHDLLLALNGSGQDHYLALTWSGGKVLEALSEFTRERPETLQGKDAAYLIFNVLDPDTFGSDIYRAAPGKAYECILRCVPYAQRFEALNQFLRAHDAFIDGQSVSPCGPDHP